MTAEEFLFACKLRNLTLAEIEEFNLGFIIDYINTYDGIMLDEKPTSTTRKATQNDFDNF